jgi:hypothetical protein
MENHESIRLYLDRDETGQKYTKRTFSEYKYKDESNISKL